MHLAVLAVTTLAQAEEEKNILLPALGELIVGSIAFLVVFAFMARYAWPRISATLAERTENIEGKLDQAERDRAEAQTLLARYREQLDRAHGEAAEIVEEGRRRGAEARREIVAKAEQEAARILARGEEQLRVERERAIGEVRRDVGQLAVLLATRIIGESLDAQRQQALVDRFIDEIEGEPQGPGEAARGPAPGGAGRG
jgi:F-type H+-transporting ATPase subunit b